MKRLLRPAAGNTRDATDVFDHCVLLDHSSGVTLDLFAGADGFRMGFQADIRARLVESVERGISAGSAAI
jgi:hypothetical protein